ncbi:MAG: ATP-dependent DNA ligase [Acidimicrobiales bacterium]
MALPVVPPVAPMLARASRELPEGDGYVYEPKWDGFRCIVFREGEGLTLSSRNERDLTRYFPELEDALGSNLPADCVLDGEIVIAGAAGLDFDALLNRIHPAASRIARLASETPASFVAFDLLCIGDQDLRAEPYVRRRQLLEQSFKDLKSPFHLTPATSDLRVAEDWFERFEGAGLDGIVAKKADDPYAEGRRVMVKVKHERTADCVVGGFRWHKAGGKVGSLLLGLFDADRVLHHVGVTSTFSDAERTSLVGRLEAYRTPPAGHPWAGDNSLGSAPGRRPGGQSRWSSGRDLSFEPLRPELVCEVAYDHLQGNRFRHATTFRRWRPDRSPDSCRYEQLGSAVPAELSSVFGAVSSHRARGSSAP